MIGRIFKSVAVVGLGGLMVTAIPLRPAVAALNDAQKSVVDAALAAPTDAAAVKALVTFIKANKTLKVDVAVAAATAWCPPAKKSSGVPYTTADVEKVFRAIAGVDPADSADSFAAMTIACPIATAQLATTLSDVQTAAGAPLTLGSGPTVQNLAYTIRPLQEAFQKSEGNFTTRLGNEQNFVETGTTTSAVTPPPPPRDQKPPLPPLE